jgi:triosephosphate isomerase (TIM)
MINKVVAANWKMNKTAAEAQIWASGLIESLDEIPSDVQVIVAAPAIYLRELGQKFRDQPRVKIAAQNCHHEQKGAYTGEISPSMLRSVGVDYCIIGHSERRSMFLETNELISLKVKACLEVNLTPIVCVGETLAERESGYHYGVITEQITAALTFANPEKPIIIAYEPVWAIGTGISATNEQAAEMHALILGLLAQYNFTNTPVLYGGSCNDGNAAALFSMPGISGGLVGTAALNIRSFVRITQSFS